MNKLYQLNKPMSGYDPGTIMTKTKWMQVLNISEYAFNELIKNGWMK